MAYDRGSVPQTQSPIKPTELSSINPTNVDRWPFLRRFNNLKTEQLKWVASWMELSKWQSPTRGFFFNQVPDYGSKIDATTLIDNYARRCIRDFASGMLSGLTSPARPWFRLGLDNTDLQQFQPVKQYLDECQKRMTAVFARSNIYECLHILYEELATFGTGSMFLMEDYQDILRGRSFTIGEYMLGTSPDCRVNTFARQFWMTVAQLVKEFGLESCSQSVRNDFAVHNTERWVRVIWLIEENDRRIEQYKDWQNMKYRSIYFEDSSMQNTYLRMEGFNEFPILAPRWALTTTADSYGKSAGWDSLGDVKQLQKEQADKLLGVAKATNPPMQADSSVQNVNTLPGGLTRSSAMTPNAGIRPAYQVQLDLNAVREDIKEIKEALSDAYYRDLFKGILDIDRTGVTATEIAEKKAEQLNLASPLILRITNEVCNPLINRAYEIMNRVMALPPPPKEIQGQEIKITYIGVLAQAQRMIGIGAIDQWKQGVESSIQINPECIDIIDYDTMNQEKADMFGIPAKIVASPDVIAQKRQQRAQANAQAQKAAQMQQAAEIASKGTSAIKNLGNTPVGQGNAIDKVTALMPKGNQ